MKPSDVLETWNPEDYVRAFLATHPSPMLNIIADDAMNLDEPLGDYFLASAGIDYIINSVTLGDVQAWIRAIVSAAIDEMKDDPGA